MAVFPNREPAASELLIPVLKQPPGHQIAYNKYAAAQSEPAIMSRTLIGVIADTHGLLRPEAVTALKHSEYIIHAGDIGDSAILDQLGEIAPVRAVRGNVDRGKWALKIPLNNALEIGDVAIYVLHNLQDLDLKAEAARFAAVVSGHSHVPKQEVINGVLYFNPGSAGPRRFDLPVSVGQLIVENGKVRGEIVKIG
jgi:uncharacterized protein